MGSALEDNAHGLFARYKGEQTGTLGCLATQSFHETKNITCGEGGALFINDPSLAKRALIIREKGTNRSRFLRGEVDKYSWVDLGSSYLPSDILAAFLYAQLEGRHAIQNKRQQIWNGYYERLQPWALENNVRLPIIPADCEQAYHMFYLLLPTTGYRDLLISHLKSKGILSVFHCVPLRLSDAGKRFTARPTHCPVTESVSERLIRLPFFNDLSGHDQDQVADAICRFSVQPLRQSA